MTRLLQNASLGGPMPAIRARLIALGAVAMLLPSAGMAAGSGLVDTTGNTPLPVAAFPHLLVAPDPAAPGILRLAANISQDDLDEFAALGRSLIKKDRLATELRRRQGQGAGQFGFEVGVGVTNKDTAPGPGKDRVGEALSPAEKQGFDIGMAYTLERNRNLKRALIGAAIAREDDEVQEARTADRDVFYWLGFDIATAIFGDPELGAQGNTATGPGSLGARDALVSAAARRGFNDAVTFHLARSY